jgi:hypothetical protein
VRAERAVRSEAPAEAKIPPRPRHHVNHRGVIVELESSTGRNELILTYVDLVPAHIDLNIFERDPTCP